RAGLVPESLHDLHEGTEDASRVQPYEGGLFRLVRFSPKSFLAPDISALGQVCSDIPCCGSNGTRLCGGGSYGLASGSLGAGSFPRWDMVSRIQRVAEFERCSQSSV